MRSSPASRTALSAGSSGAEPASSRTRRTFTPAGVPFRRRARRRRARRPRAPTTCRSSMPHVSKTVRGPPSVESQQGWPARKSLSSSVSTPCVDRHRERGAEERLEGDAQLRLGGGLLEHAAAGAAQEHAAPVAHAGVHGPAGGKVGIDDGARAEPPPRLSRLVRIHGRPHEVGVGEHAVTVGEVQPHAAAATAAHAAPRVAVGGEALLEQRRGHAAARRDGTGLVTP